MGACATKPKVLKADSGEAPEPAPEDPTSVVTKLENDGDGKATEIIDVDVDADANDDKGDSKTRSLSHLFDDQKEEKESNEKVKTTTDPSEKEEISPPITEKEISPPPPVPEEKASETNLSEPPPSDSVTDKTTIISDEAAAVLKTEKIIENESKNPQPIIIEESIKVEISNEITNPPQNIDPSEKSTETEKEVKVITN